MSPLPTAGSDPHARRLELGLRRGDAWALEALHAQYGTTVFDFLRGTLGDRGAAKDVFQLVLTEVWRRGPSSTPAGVRSGALS